MPIGVPGVYAGNIPDDVTVFKDRLIAVGGVNDGCCDGGFSKGTKALVWISRDAPNGVWRRTPTRSTWDIWSPSPRPARTSSPSGR